MSRTPARFRQADIARAIKAVQQTGADMRVKLLPDGTIVIEKGEEPDLKPKEALASSQRIVM